MLIYLQMIEGPADQSKFEKIYREYRGLMFHVAYQILHHTQDAEDAVHHAFVKVAENIKNISDPVCPKTKSYIVIIVETKAIDMLRSRQKHIKVELDEAFSGISVNYDGDNVLTQCILQLPARYRDVILLKYHHGYNLREIAKIMGISLSAANKLDQRAKQKLHNLCEKEGLL